MRRLSPFSSALLACGILSAQPRITLEGHPEVGRTEFRVRVEPPSEAIQVAIRMPAMPGMLPIRAEVQGDRVRATFPHGGDYIVEVKLAEHATELPLHVGGDHDSGLAGMGPGIPQSGWYASGTSQEPRSSPHNMLRWRLRDWDLMVHGVAFLVESQQTGPRGRDKLFSPNWGMVMASHRAGPGTLTLRTMLTLEPLTISGGRYPLIFQTGETYKGIPIISGQHPHDLFMELAASYQIRLGEHTAFTLYGGPRGDPALGPPAFPHRLSASENPLAAIGHHLQDSTHIATNVVTAGITQGPVTWEVSGFHGREPDEKRWGIEGGEIDSLSTRLTVTPTARWTAQFSIGRINNREATHPQIDSLRTTASLSYVRPVRGGHWATTLVWGRNHDLEFTQLPGSIVLPKVGKTVLAPRHIVSVPTRIPGQIYNSYLAESTLRFHEKHWLWGRIESADKDTTVLFEEDPFVLLVDEQHFTRVQLYTGGYGHELWRGRGLSVSLGEQLTLFHAPPNLAPVYGTTPLGMQVFVRVRAGSAN